MIKAAVIGGTNCVCDKLTLTPLWSDYDILIISYMTADLLTATALGFETEITKALFKNKKVYMLKQATAHLANPDKPLFSLYKLYINKILSYGVKVFNCTDEMFGTENGKKLLNAADLSTLSNTVYKVGKQTIITPLALDLAREKNITIIKDDAL